MTTKEVDLMDRRGKKDQDCQPQPMTFWTEPQHIAIGETQQRKGFDQCPERDRSKKGTQEIVDVLAFKPTHVRWIFRRELRVILEVCSLLALDVEKQLYPTKEQEDPGAVDKMQPEDPAP